MNALSVLYMIWVMTKAKTQDPEVGARFDPMVVAGRLYALFEDADGWVGWLNRKSASEAWDAARTLALGIARGTGLGTTEAARVEKVLAPVLDRCWSLCRPVLEARAAEARRGSPRARRIPPRAKRISLRARIWPRPRAILSEGPAFGEEDLQVFRFFLFLLDEGNAAALRTCSRRDCSKLFVDRSRGKIGKYCSAACRSRAFRESE